MQFWLLLQISNLWTSTHFRRIYSLYYDSDAKFEVSTAVKIQVDVLWVVTPCGTSPCRWRKCGPPKRQYGNNTTVHYNPEDLDLILHRLENLIFSISRVVHTRARTHAHALAPLVRKFVLLVGFVGNLSVCCRAFCTSFLFTICTPVIVFIFVTFQLWNNKGHYWTRCRTGSVLARIADNTGSCLVCRQKVCLR